MDKYLPAAKSAIGADEHWENALQQALDQTAGLATVDVAILFAHSFYAEHFPALLARLQEATGASLILGCSGETIIGQGVELEHVPDFRCCCSRYQVRFFILCALRSL